MTEEEKKYFTIRVTQSNRTALVVILYEIVENYIDDADECLLKKDYDMYKIYLDRAWNTVMTLNKNLNFKYKISDNLSTLYLYAGSLIKRSRVSRRMNYAYEARNIMTSLKDAYVEVAKTDDSKPLMRNSQQIYAGITYGRGVLNEMCKDQGNKRGYRV